MKSNLHKIQIKKRRASDKALVGANCLVLLDGKQLKGVTSVTFKIDARGVGRVHLEMIPSDFKLDSFIRVTKGRKK